MSSDVSAQGRILACAIATWVIAALFVGLRFYLRGHLMKVLGWEDWTILMSSIFSGAVSACFIAETHFGLGRHVASLTPTQLSAASKLYWASTLFFAITIYLTKFSVLSLYIRTLTHDWVQRTLRVLMVFVVLTCLTDMCLVFTQCVPLEAVWNAGVDASYCHPYSTYYTIVGIQIATDFLIFLLPLPVIWGMRAAPRNQKLMLFTLFSFGFFICIVSIIRLTELTATRRDTDWTFYSVNINFWSLIQANTGIVCACVMTMKPLLSRLIPGSGGAGTTRTRHRRGITESKPGDQLGHSVDLFRPPTIGSRPSRPNSFAPHSSAGAHGHGGGGGFGFGKGGGGKGPGGFGKGPGGILCKKQSWFTAQLARLDRSLQTVNEGSENRAGPGSPGLGALEAGGLGGISAPTSRRSSLVAMFLAVPLRAHLVVPRLSHHSSIITTHVEQEAAEEMDEGPLEPARYARRSSCAV